DTDDNARIRHACDLDVVQIVSDTEALFKGGFERLNTRASRMDQRPVEVEKHEASCNCGLHFCSGALRATRECCDSGYAALVNWRNFVTCAFQNREFAVAVFCRRVKTRYSLQSWRVHHQHGDHAPEKHE